MVNSCTDYRRGYEEAQARYRNRVKEVIKQVDDDFSKADLDGVVKPCKECLDNYKNMVKKYLYEIILN